LVVLREDLADSGGLVVAYAVPAVPAAPLINPVTGCLATWRVEPPPRQASIEVPENDALEDECQAPTVMRARAYVVRGDFGERSYVGDPGAVADAQLCVTGVRFGGTGSMGSGCAPALSRCQSLHETEAFIDNVSPPPAGWRETAPEPAGTEVIGPAVGVSRTPREPGLYLLVVEAADSPLQRLPEILIGYHGLDQCLLTGGGWYAVPFFVLPEGPLTVGPGGSWREGFALVAGGDQPNYVKAELERDRPIVRARVVRREQDVEVSSAVIALRRIRDLEDGRGAYLGAFRISSDPAIRAEWIPAEAEALLRDLPVVITKGFEGRISVYLEED
jgi:hypothetical protein